jgi:RNA polymerase sigma-54 factor
MAQHRGPRGDAVVPHLAVDIASDENGSAAAVRHRIAQLVQAENPADPLSDDAIAKIISDEGIQLARRTVAKYRDLLHIGSSTQRRRQALVAGRA